MCAGLLCRGVLSNSVRILANKNSIRITRLPCRELIVYVVALRMVCSSGGEKNRTTVGARNRNVISEICACTLGKRRESLAAVWFLGGVLFPVQ